MFKWIFLNAILLFVTGLFFVIKAFRTKRFSMTKKAFVPYLILFHIAMIFVLRFSEKFQESYQLKNWHIVEAQILPLDQMDAEADSSLVYYKYHVEHTWFTGDVEKHSLNSVPQDSTLSVYYDPHAPSHSVLDTPNHKLHVVLLLLASVALIILFYIVMLYMFK